MRRPRSYTYPLHELVADWAGQLLDPGGDLRFGVEVTGVEQSEDGAVVSAVRDTVPVTVECEAVVAGDGAGGLLSNDEAAVSAVYPARWLTLIAAVPPSAGGAIHLRLPARLCRSVSPLGGHEAVHAGAAGGRRLQPVGRWAELGDKRLAAGQPPAIQQGEFTERDILDHRVRVAIPCSTAFPDRFPSHLLGSPAARSPAQLTGTGSRPRGGRA